MTVWRPGSAQATSIAKRSAATEHLARAAREGIDEVVADALEGRPERERADNAVRREAHVEVRARTRGPDRREVPSPLQLVEGAIDQAHRHRASRVQPVASREARAGDAAREAERDGHLIPFRR